MESSEVSVQNTAVAELYLTTIQIFILFYYSHPTASLRLVFSYTYIYFGPIFRGGNAAGRKNGQA